MDVSSGTAKLLASLSFQHACVVRTVTLVFSASNALTVAILTSNGHAHVHDGNKADHVDQLHHDEVQSIALSADGLALATASGDCTAKIWNVATRSCSHILRGHRGSVKCACFSLDRVWIATGSADGTAIIWNVTTGECRHVLEGQAGPVYKAVFSANGGFLATAASVRNAVKIWDIVTGACKISYEKDPAAAGPLHAAFSGDMPLVAMGCNGAPLGHAGFIRFYNPEIGKFHGHLWKGYNRAIRRVVFLR